MHRDNYRGKEGGEEIIQARAMENIIDVTRLWKFPIDVPLGRASGGDEHLDAQKSAQGGS